MYMNMYITVTKAHAKTALHAALNKTKAQKNIMSNEMLNDE